MPQGPLCPKDPCAPRTPVPQGTLCGGAVRCLVPTIPGCPTRRRPSPWRGARWRRSWSSDCWDPAPQYRRWAGTGTRARSSSPRCSPPPWSPGSRPSCSGCAPGAPPAAHRGWRRRRSRHWLPSPRWATLMCCPTRRTGGWASPAPTPTRRRRNPPATPSGSRSRTRGAPPRACTAWFRPSSRSPSPGSSATGRCCCRAPSRRSTACCSGWSGCCCGAGPPAAQSGCGG